MICFWCKAGIESDHICQEIAAYMEGPTTPEDVAMIRIKFEQFEARRHE